jgi:polar amino acid transport system substrate-binding protein
MIRLMLALIWCGWCSQSLATTKLTLYAYHNSPPFVINADAETGLNYDLVRALQQQLGTKYQLEYKYLPRYLLNQRLQEGLPTIVLWSSSTWFTNKAHPYLWSETVFADRDVFVTLSNSVTKFEQLTDLAGSTLGAIRGYSYPGVNELVAQHRVTRLDAESDKENLTRLLERNVDQIVITRSSFLFYARQQQYLGKMKIIGQPYPNYQRQLLLSQHYQPLKADFDQAILALPKQHFWITRMELYGLKAD